MVDVGPGDASFVRRWGTAEGFRFGWLSPAVAYWLGATALALTAAVVLVLVFRETPVPPGGDPGNWVSTGLAYYGRPYPSQLVPLAYPPVMFPLLGAVAVLAGGPLLGSDLFAGALMLAFGLSFAALATTLLRSRIVALALVALVLADPAVLAMFFWGAYPNLLGFVFLNLAFVGLLRAARGRTSTGAVQFWGFGALATLTHSLVGVALGATMLLFAVFAFAVPTPDAATLLERARRRTLDAPGVALRALVGSRAGRAGAVVFAVLVGGYYGLTYLGGIPHPYYLASDPVGFRILSMAGAFQALVPSAVLPPSVVLAILVTACSAAAVGFLFVRERWPHLLTGSAVLLVAWPLAISLLFVAGYLGQIVTDYHRFGYFYIVPVGLLLAYLAERGWVLRGRRAAPSDRDPGPDDRSSPYAPPRPRFAVPGSIPRAVRRPLLFGAVSLLILLTVLSTSTVPALARDQHLFTRVNHDPEFLSAVRAIQGAGVAGAVLTLPGADKWVRGLTGENAYAPYSVNDYLFYPTQQLDSQLSYYALSSHFALTNGYVSATVRAVHPGFSEGVPGYSVSVLGSMREVLRIAPGDLRVVVHNPANGTTYSEGLGVAPSVTMPTSLGTPMVLQFVTPDYWLTIQVALSPSAPDAELAFLAGPTGPLQLTGLDVAIVPSAGGVATAGPGASPGTFLWTPLGDVRRPLTFGNVSPASALQLTANYDRATGGAAVGVAFGPVANGSGAFEVGGSINLSTPSAAAVPSGGAQSLSTPVVWQSLGVRFVLMRNESVGPTPYLDLAGEVAYLVAEYGLPVLYQNPEWSVLEVPASPAPSG